MSKKHLVDAYNLDLIKSYIAMVTLDMDRLDGDDLLLSAQKGEKMLGICISEPIELEGNELVVFYEEKLMVIYPSRDADETKVTLDMKNMHVLMCSAYGIERGVLDEASRVAVDYVNFYSVGGLEK